MRQKYKIVILNKHFLKQQSFTKLANVHLGLGSGNDSVEETKRYEVNELSVPVPRRREEPICLTFSCKMASYSLFSSSPFFSWTPLILGTPEQIFWEILFNSSTNTTNHEEGPFRPLSLPLRHFRSFSLIRAPFWPAGGSMPSYVPCINIGQKTYLKKEMSKNEISRDFTYALLVLLLLLSMQLLIM